MSNEIRCKVQRASNYTVSFGTGPHYDERSGRLYHVDQNNGDCYYLDIKTGIYGTYHLGPGVTFILPIKGQPNKFIVSQQKQILTLDWSAKDAKCIRVVEPQKATHIKDAKCDPRGRLWLGTMWFGTMKWSQQPVGLFAFGMSSLYSMDPTLNLTPKREGCSLASGMAWSKDKRKFFMAETIERQIWAFDYDNHSGNLSNCKTVFDYYNSTEMDDLELPDGLTIDLHDKLWIASSKGQKVLRVDPETGKMLGIIKTPAKLTTSVTWGGPDFRTLYFTTARDDYIPEQDAGAVFKVNFEQENIRGSSNRPFKFK